MSSLKNVYVSGNTINIVVQDSPIFKLIKKDTETGKTIADAKFVIWKLDESGNEEDYAKDINGKYIGELNEEQQYVVTTNEEGIITLPLPMGLYKAVEVEYPAGYEEQVIEEIFRITGKDEEEQSGRGEVLLINSIEDLVDFSNSVNAGNNYNGMTVKLMRSLDFKDDKSYDDPLDTSYGDLNGNNVIEGIKVELIGNTKETMKQIGTYYSFKGTFDGQNNEIENLYYQYQTGLFGTVESGTIKNLGIVGGNAYLVNNITNGKIKNCYHTGSISGSGRGVGIVDVANNSVISNCYNTGYLRGNGVAGIAFGINNSTISNCYNTGTLESSTSSGYSSGYGGGIIGYMKDNCTVIDCYNSGFIEVGAYNPNAGGIVGAVNMYGQQSCVILNCYNTASVYASGYTGNIGGIVGYSKYLRI